MGVNLDLSVLGERTTWSAAILSAVLFSGISLVGLSAFDLAGDQIGSGGDVRPIPRLVYESLERDGIETEVMNEDGLIDTSRLEGKIMIIDMMAHDCSSCHAVQYHLEEKMQYWDSLVGERELVILGYGSWYDESIEYLNQSDGEYTVPQYPTGLGSPQSAILENGTLGDPVRYLTPGGTGSIPVVILVDHEGYILAREITGIPLDGWSSFDSSVEIALTGTDEDIVAMRGIGVSEVNTSLPSLFFLGAMLSILVFFSPCAFPVLPSFIGFQMSMATSLDDLAGDGESEAKAPLPPLLGLASGTGMVTFFAAIGAIAAMMGAKFADWGVIWWIALLIACSLFVLGTLNLLGWSSNLFSAFQRWLDRRIGRRSPSDLPRPMRDMFLYGAGYAAASIDCTAIAVIPFVVYLGGMGLNSVLAGLIGLTFGLMLLMVSVVSMVGYGRGAFANRMSKYTNGVKLVGAWMMIYAGIVLTIYLNRPDVILSVLEI